ncbi:MAG: hypothetical protein J6M41_10635 [Prevotella sp.]|nr:hypothetical protein [Prevotella sp.]
MNDVPFIKQEEPNECGVAALTSIASYYLRRKVDYGGNIEVMPYTYRRE